MFWVRLRSGILLVILAFLAIMPGGWVLWGMALAVSLIGLDEYYRATGVRKPKDNVLAVAGYLLSAGYYCLLPFGFGAHGTVTLVGAMLALLAVYVFTFPRYQSEQVASAFFGIVYVSVMLSFIYQTRELQNGQFLVWLIFLCAWGCDTCAYCVGMLIGKHQMSPVLSPKKSVEGAIGGVCGAALLGALYAWALRAYFPTGQHIWIFAVICAVGALISMVGDLAASAIKRNHGIKDYGKIIPGHGGILDRFDSVIVTAPIIYFLAERLL